MGLIEQARLDYAQIITNSNDFGVTLILVNPNTSPNQTATITGTGKHISLTFDELGMVQAKGSNATCTIAESSLISAGYTYKDSNGDITFKGHRVTMTDATRTGVYAIEAWIPDRTIGGITLELGDFV